MSVPPLDIFRDPPRAQMALAALHEAFVRSGTPRSLEEFAPELERRLGEAADPDMALTNLLRFVEASVSRSALFTDLLVYPSLFDLLLLLFGSSMYLSDILVREPGLFRWLSTSDALRRGPSAQELCQETTRIGSTFRDAGRKIDALRRLHRREILRIGARDLTGRASVRETTGDLSAVADAAIDGVYEFVREDLEARYGIVEAPPFAIVGLGKLGGNELNYSSDVDLLFVYEREGELTRTDGRAMSCEEFFNRLGEQLVVRLSEQSAEGTLYRVDMRLRPEAGAGPLARSLQRYLLYYEARGELWERQMLLKARVVGGDRTLGAALLDRLVPFVYPRSSLLHPAEYVGRIKARIEASAADPGDVKLMPGGIRDVEFTVQTMQLLAAGKNPALRTGNTLEAVERLVQHGELGVEEGEALRQAYELFRVLEHRLQTQLNTQTHTLPDDEHGRTTLARLAGFTGAAQLEKSVAGAAAAVRAVFDRVLTVPEEPTRSGIQAMLEGGAGEEAVASLLAAHGIRDLRKALKSIRVLSSGSALTGAGDARLREAFHRVAEALLQDVARTPSPDQTIATLALLVSAQRFPHQLVELLGNERFRRLVVDICAVGPRLARTLAAHPLMLESLATDPAALSSPVGPPPESGESLIGWKQREESRALVRHTLGFVGFEELTRDLSAIADRVVLVSLEQELRRARVRAPLVVAAVGKFGSRELGLDADLDLFFVGRSRRSAQHSALERCAAAVVRALSVVSAEGTLYSVDTRLRPEGRNAPLVIELDAYQEYLATRASLWERQSLTRFRVVAGANDLAERAARLVEDAVYGSPLPAGWVREILAMRSKTESRARLRHQEDLDLKLGAGGIMDVEFLSQIVQLHLGREHPELRRASVLEVVRAAPSSVLSQDERSLLIGAHGLFRQAETAMRLTLEERTTILPQGEALMLLAAMMQRPSGAALHEEVRSAMVRVRALLTTVSERIET